MTVHVLAIFIKLVDSVPQVGILFAQMQYHQVKREERSLLNFLRVACINIAFLQPCTTATTSFLCWPFFKSIALLEVHQSLYITSQNLVYKCWMNYGKHILVHDTLFEEIDVYHKIKQMQWQ